MVGKYSVNVLFLAAEADPFAKVGGLADVSSSLPSALRSLAARRSYDVRLVIPYHPPVRQKFPDLPVIARYSVESLQGDLPVTVYYSEAGGKPTYLVSGSPIANSPTIYSTDARVDGWKYAFFSLACLKLPEQLGWKPDIIHANDWHSALSVYALKQRKELDDYFSRTGSILTIHNLPFMGAGTEEAFQGFKFVPSQNQALPWWARRVPLPLGIQAADRIVAVSPTYAREILTPDYGCGLEGFLATRLNAVSGIINGIDDQCLNPATDSFIQAQYSSATLDLRAANKKALAESYNLNPDPAIPLVVMIGRMDQQKGVDLALESLRMGRNLPWQAIILGTGDPQLEDAARKLAADFPTRVRATLKFDGKLAHELYSGGDLILMPSRYEPCGLPQMIAMRYGCVPLARSTGGLKDTITDAEDDLAGTGFLFDAPSAMACGEALKRALKLFDHPEAWKALQLRGMAQDFSWRKSAAAYADLYDQLLEANP